MSDVKLTIVFDSQSGYTFRLEGNPDDTDKAIRGIDLSIPVGILIKAVLENAAKECNNGG